MSNKIVNGISGVIKIVCAALTGLGIGALATYYTSWSVITMDIARKSYIFVYLFLAMAITGFLGMIFIAALQLRSVFKPGKLNLAQILIGEILIFIFILPACTTYMLYATIFEVGTYVAIIVSYWLAVVITLIEAIFLFVKIRKEKIKVFEITNCMSIINLTVKILVPVLIIFTIWIFDQLISQNKEMIALNESLKGGFDSFTMSDFDGDEYTEDIFKGHKVTMINIWGTYCHPCIGEMPELEEIAEMYDEETFQLIGIPGDLYIAGQLDQDQIDKALEIIEATGAKYQMLIPSPEIDSGILASVQALPTTIFLDENGNQIKTVEGARSKVAWITEIQEVLDSEE